MTYSSDNSNAYVKCSYENDLLNYINFFRFAVTSSAWSETVKTIVLIDYSIYD